MRIEKESFLFSIISPPVFYRNPFLFHLYLSIYIKFISISKSGVAIPEHQKPQQQQSKTFRDMYNINGQIAPPITYFNGQNLPDHSHHPPYIPPFHVVGLAPGPVPVAPDGSDDLQWNYGFEPKKKRPKEQEFLENNSQISSLDFLQPRSVSTGLGLSLDNGRLTSSGDSQLLALVGDDIDLQLLKQDAEIDKYIKLQGDRLRQSVLEKVQANQFQAISYIEERFLQKFREKDAEVENVNKKNAELESHIEQLAMEATAWQQRAKYSESMIEALNFNLQRVYAKSRDSKEGCGDSEVDDTASCCNGRGTLNYPLLCKDNNEMKALMACKVCRVNEVSMLLLPCKHLCVCKECESRVSHCPLCQSSKYIGMEIYM